MKIKKSPSIKLILCLILFAFSSNVLFSQVTHREIGVKLNRFRNIDLIYKRGTADRLIRYEVMLPSIGYQGSNLIFAAKLGIGVEKRKSLTDKLDFIHGFSSSITSSRFNVLSLTNNDRRLVPQTLFSLKVGYMLGLRYKISDSFAISLSTTPSLDMGFSFDDRSFRDDLKLRGGFNARPLSLTFTYRLKPKKNP